MIEQGLVYIHSVKPARRFVGCGALVEGGYVATCRHVWRMATDAAAKAEPNEPLTVEVEYPRSRQDGGGTVRRTARLVDACDAAANPTPDLVLLLPDEIPSAGVMKLQLATHERFQVGDGYAIAAIARDEKSPDTPRDVKIPGAIADHEDTSGRREFTGSNPNGYWFQRGSSGSLVFVDGGEQLAGIVSLSELGANEGKSLLHEAFVVPGTTIRAHVVRLTAGPVARGQHLDVAELQPVLDALGVQDVPLAEIPSRLKAFIEAARAHAAEQVAASNQGVDIDATIAAARAKLGSLDTAGAQMVLRVKIAEVEETHRQRLIPLLEEKAAVERLSYEYEGAKATLNQLLALDSDRVWSWIALGDLGVTTGFLGAAAMAFNAALAVARRTGKERDESVTLNCLGDVLVAQGNLSEALKSFRDGLAIRDRLAKADPGNAGWQRDLAVSYNKIGDALVAQGNLPDALKSFRDGLAIAERLAKADPGNAGWQRDLSVSYERVGGVLVAQGNLPEALNSFRDDLAIAERLAKADPGNAGWQRDLAVSYNKIGDVLVAQGNLPDALKSFRDGLAIAERLAKADPGNAGWQRDLSVSYERVGDVLVAQGNLPEALKSFRDGLAIRDRLAKADPGNAGWQRDLSVSYNKIGDVLVAQGNLPEALKSFRASHHIFDRLAKADPGNAGWQRDLSVSYERVGSVLVARGNLSEALKSFRDGLAIADRLAKADPGNAGWQRDLATSHAKLAGVRERMGETGAALEGLHLGRAIMLGLTKLSPDNVVWKRDLDWFDRQIARLKP
jgi:tetratricopeptide (TPR) repeat protein